MAIWLLPTSYALEYGREFFKGTLTENAVAWYNDLPYNSIDSWDELERVFLFHYIHNAKSETNIFDMQAVKQMYNDPLKKFFSR